MNRTKRFSPEIRECAGRLVFEHRIELRQELFEQGAKFFISDSKSTCSGVNGIFATRKQRISQFQKTS